MVHNFNLKYKKPYFNINNNKNYNNKIKIY